jgi:hypothetical protein
MEENRGGWNKGKLHLESTRIKMSISQKNRKDKRGLYKGMIPWNKGKNATEQAKIHQSLAHTKEKEFTGFKRDERHRMMNTIQYKEWRLQVFGRDNYTCMDCGVRGVYLEAHHIKSFQKYPELRFDINNGKTLCQICHKNNDDNRGKREKNRRRLL